MDPDALEVVVGIMCGYRPKSDGAAAIKRVPIGERLRAAEFLVTILHGHPKQPVEADWPTNVNIIVRPSDVGPGREE